MIGFRRLRPKSFWARRTGNMVYGTSTTIVLTDNKVTRSNHERMSKKLVVSDRSEWGFQSIDAEECKDKKAWVSILYGGEFENGIYFYSWPYGKYC